MVGVVDQSYGLELLVATIGQSCWLESLVVITGQSFRSKLLIGDAVRGCWSKVLVRIPGQSCSLLRCCFLVVSNGQWVVLEVLLVDGWNLRFGWFKEFVGKANGCEMSGRVYPCSCTVTVNLSLGSQAGSYLTRYRFHLAGPTRAI